MSQAMHKLRQLQKQLYAYHYAIGVIEVDESTVAPAGGGEGRGEALEILSGAEYALIADPALPALLDEAAKDELTEAEAAQIRELRRMNDQISRIPADEYAAGARLMNDCRAAWHKAKLADDFSIYQPWLEKMVDNRRRWAKYFDPDRDAFATWLDQNQPGLTVAETDAFFAGLRETIVPLLHRIRTEGTAPRADFLKNH